MLNFFVFFSDLVWSAAVITRHAKSGRSGARSAMLNCLLERQELSYWLDSRSADQKWTATVRKEQKSTEGGKIQQTKNDAKQNETDIVI